MNVYSQILELEHLIARGAEAEVWGARDAIGGHTVIFKKTLLEPEYGRTALLERIRLAGLLSESGFLAVMDLIGGRSGITGFTTRPVPSVDFATVAHLHGSDGVVQVLVDVCWALEQLHRLDYVHCDLKPDNILIECGVDGPQAYLTDLDWAVRRGSQRPLMFRGTPPYAAPESTGGGSLTEETDAYALGVLIERDILPLLPDTVCRRRLGALGNLLRDRTQPSERPTVESARLTLRSLKSQDREMGRELFPALRDAGLRTRIAGLMRASHAAHESGKQGILVTGPPGIGKSRVMRGACQQTQLSGGAVLRVEGVRALSELRFGLTEWVSALRVRNSMAPTDPILVFAETEPSFRPPDSGWEGIRGVRLVLEGRSEDGIPPGFSHYRVPPWTQRECMAAIAHLHDHAPLTAINSEAITLAAGGIPRLARHFIRHWYNRPKALRETESLNIDWSGAGPSDYWAGRFADLPRVQKELLTRACIFHRTFTLRDLLDQTLSGSDAKCAADPLIQSGWLTPDDSAWPEPSLRVVCRSARNYLRCRIGRARVREYAASFLGRSEPMSGDDPPPRSEIDAWELRRLAGQVSATIPDRPVDTLDDHKVCLYARLLNQRDCRSRDPITVVQCAHRLSAGFERIGSIRRQQRWASFALDRLSPIAASGAVSLDTAHLVCDLYKLAVDPHDVAGRIEEFLGAHTTAAAEVRGYLLSELGGMLVWMGRYSDGGRACREAHELLSGQSQQSEDYGRNLNRLGLASIRTGRYADARRFLEDALRVADAGPYPAVGWRCHGNLGLLSRDLGEPAAAMDCSRRVIRFCREHGMLRDYLSALIDRSVAFVDLGGGHHALRTARLALALAEGIGDPVNMGYASQTLGWVSVVHGLAGAAHTHIRESIRLWRRVRKELLEARAVLNLGWLAILVRHAGDAEALASSVVDTLAAHNDLHGLCEAQLIRAHAAMQEDDCSRAEAHLRQIPMDDPVLPPRYHADAQVALAMTMVLQGDLERAKPVLDLLDTLRPVRDVSQTNLDYRRVAALYYMATGDADRAAGILEGTLADCRRARREDRRIETIAAQAELATRIGNFAVAERYLDIAAAMIGTMREDLPCRSIRSE